MTALRPLRRAAMLLLALVDGGLGLLLLVWPGAWIEVVQPRAPIVPFEIFQYLGVFWTMRALLVGLLALGRRPDWAVGAAIAWALPIPGDLLLAWRCSADGPHTALAYVSHACLGAIAVLVLRPRRPAR